MLKTKYKYIVMNGKNIQEHRAIMEAHLGRKLLKTEVVHHINRIRDDNRIENLQVMNKIEHAKLPRVLDHNKNNDRLQIRIDHEDKENIIKVLGKKYNTTISEYIRKLLQDVVNEI